MSGPRHRVPPPSRYDLYEWCVQAPEMQARFLRALHARSPRTLCEDFCGPASIARAWSSLDPRARAFGIDRDPEPIAHANRRAHEQGLTAARFRGLRADVLKTATRADVIAAFNFAVCELHERSALVAYLRRARKRLNPRGVFACDIYGGASAFLRGRTRKRIRTPVGLVEYTWDQQESDPLTARVENAIHFRLRGSMQMPNAFRYDWRLWTVAEVREAMAEAGFASSEVHLSYGEALDMEGNPIPVPATADEPIGEEFVAYIIARLASSPLRSGRSGRRAARRRGS